MFHQPVPVAYGVMPHQHSMYSYHELENSALTAAAAEHQQLDEKEAYKLAALRQAVLSPAGNSNKAQVIYEVSVAGECRSYLLSHAVTNTLVLEMNGERNVIV